MLYSQAKNTDHWIRLYVRGLYPVGSFRRKEETINDLDYVTMRPLTYILDEFRVAYMQDNDDDIIVDEQGDYYMSLKMKMDFGYFQVDFWRARDKYEYFFLKTMRTLDKDHNIYWRRMAINKGLRLSDRGLYKGSHNRVNLITNTKKELERELGIKQRHL